MKSTKKHAACETEITEDGRYFWKNGKDLEIESDYDNWAHIFDKCDPEKQKYRYKLMPNTKFQPCRRFARNDLVERKIKSFRKALENFLKFKEELGLDSFKITCDKQDVIIALKVTFEGEIILTQYYIENKRLDGCLPKYKAGIVDEYDHQSRDPNYEKGRQLMIEDHGVTVIRTNPEAPNDINRVMNQIHTHIIDRFRESH